MSEYLLFMFNLILEFLNKPNYLRLLFKYENVSQFFNQMSTAYWKRLSLESWLFIGYEKAKGSIILF